MIPENNAVIAVILLVSLFTSGFCSGMESAYLSLDRIAIKKLEKSGSVISRVVLYFLDHFNQLIVTILIFNLFSNIIATLSANTLFFWYLRHVWGWETGENIIGGVMMDALFVIFFTLLVLILSEFIPKRVTILHPKFFAEAGSILLIPPYTMMYPVVAIIFKFTDQVKKIFSNERENSKPPTNGPPKSLPVFRSELLGFVEKISRQGGFHKLETDWLVQLLFYMNTPISSIMINRENLEGLDIRTLEGKNILTLIKKFPFNNIPIYRESKDNIIGIVSKKEIALKHRQASLHKEELNKYIRGALLLPKNKNIMEVLRDIYHFELDIALVVDEHGGVEGIVTANHIVTKIFERVGNEEGDNLQIRRLGMNLFSIRSEVSLDDINQFFGIALQSEHYETIGGYLLERFKTIPKKGDVTEDDHFTYTVKSRNARKIIGIEARRK